MSLSVCIQKRLGGFQLHVDFETEGGVFGLLGASGCGKSYTLKCIAGIETPDEGRIVLDGVTLFDRKKHINLPPQQRQVGYLFQSYALFPHMTVGQNIRCGLKGVKGKAEKEARLVEALRLFQLEALADHRPDQLSGGQAQRAALARILVNQPRLLMLDEPFSALDSYLRTRLQVEFQEMLSRFGQDVLLVTHDRDEAYRLCRRMAIMEAGRITVQGTREEVFATPQTQAAAAITGCKNFSAARKTGSHSLRALDWGLDLRLETPVPEDTEVIGLRAHYMTPASGPGENVLEVCQPQISETPFSVAVLFRAGEGQVRWEVDRSLWKQYANDGLPQWLRVDTRGVIPLRNGAKLL